MLTSLLYAVLLLAVMGVLFGVLLGFAAKKFAVEADPRVDQVTSVLPGANCGACGFPGCSGAADAIVKGAAPVDACPVGKAAVASKIAAIMGISFGSDGVARIATIMCKGGREECGTRFEYAGLQDCTAANLAAGGNKSCRYGCLGLGTCAGTCPFDAIVISADGLPEVDASRCTGCGKCVKACPRGLIALVREDRPVHVACMNHDKGPVVTKTCQVGCIACSICVKNCPSAAIEVSDFVARIDPEKCAVCGVCIEKCPRKTITQGPGPSEPAQETGTTVA